MFKPLRCIIFLSLCEGYSMKKIRGVELMINNKLYNVFMMETTGSAKKLMLEILIEMDPNTNFITIGGTTLHNLMDKTGMSESMVRKVVSELKSLYLIEPTKKIKAEYVINPSFAIKGDTGSVWRSYGNLERSRGNVDATVPNVGGVKIKGKNLLLNDIDFGIIGADADEKEKLRDIYYG